MGFRFKSILFIFVILGISLTAYADGGDLKLPSLTDTTQLKPFQKSTLKDASVCKYTDDILRGQLQQDAAEIFTGIEEIYVDSSKDSSAALNLSILEGKKIAQLTGCILEKHLSRRNGTTIIPIYIPDRTGPSTNWAEASKDRKLIVWVEVSWTSGKTERFSDLAPDGLMVVRVHYHRYDVNSAKSMPYQCSVPMPYISDQERLLKLLSTSIQKCLLFNYGRPYIRKAKGSE